MNDFDHLLVQRRHFDYDFYALDCVHDLVGCFFVAGDDAVKL
jgi:hypothetical protein